MQVSRQWRAVVESTPALMGHDCISTTSSCQMPLREHPKDVPAVAWTIRLLSVAYQLIRARAERILSTHPWSPGVAFASVETSDLFHPFLQNWLSNCHSASYFNFNTRSLNCLDQRSKPLEWGNLSVHRSSSTTSCWSEWLAWRASAIRTSLVSVDSSLTPRCYIFFVGRSKARIRSMPQYQRMSHKIVRTQCYQARRYDYYAPTTA